MKNIVNFFIKYPSWATVIKILIMGFGLAAVFSMKSSFFPEMDSKTISIQITYPGASPLEIEKGIIQKIEDNLKGVQGIERYTSQSRENIGTISIETLKSHDVDEVLQDVKNAVDRINSFPTGMEPPVVFKNPATEFAINFSVTGDVDIKSLKTIARDVENDLRGIKGISQVSIGGYPDEEILIAVKEDQMRAYGVSFDQISNAVRMANIDISAGSIKSRNEEILIRFEGKEYFAEEMQDIVIKSMPDGRLVLLSDVAEVSNTWAESPQSTHINGQRSVIITINKIYGEDILFITSRVREYVDEFNKENEVVKAAVLDDFTINLRDRLDMLVDNGALGIILVLISLSFFLKFRLAFWVAMAIPFSFLGMFLTGYIFGLTINVISLFGCILVVGILVDDGIVIAEQIYQNYERGRRPFSAAIRGTMEVMPSVTFAILTTIVAFLPFFFFDGRQGEMMTDMAFVVIFTIAFSLVEAFIILPAHLAHSKAIRQTKKENKFRKKLDQWLYWPRDKFYAPSLKFFLDNKIIIAASAIFMTMATIGAFKGGVIGLTFFPFIDMDSFEITLQMPAGTREYETEKYLDKIEKAVWEANEEIKKQRPDGKDVIIRVVKNMAQGQTGLWGAVNTGGSNIGTLKVVMLKGEERNMESFKISNVIREKVGPIKEAEKLSYGTGSRFGKPISIPLISPDFEELEGARQELKARLNEISELRDVSDNSPSGLREIKIRLKENARILGLTGLGIASQIRQGFFGEEIQRLQRGQDEIKVWVRFVPEDRSSMKKWEDMRIRTQNGEEFPLSQLISYEIKRENEVINHLDGNREITIEADMVDQNAEVPPVLNRVTGEILPEILAKYPSVKTAESGQKREIFKTARSARVAMPVAFIIMFFLVLLSFRSTMQAVLVFSLLPLGFIGAAWGHFFQDMPVNMMSAYGIIALTGIIVNDAIVFINTFNQYMRDGRQFKQALFDAGINRFRPILLTTLTTVLGLLPLLSETSMQAQFLKPMAISVAFGLTLASFCTLVFLPVYMMIFNKMKIYAKYIWTGQKPTPEEVEPAVIEMRKIQENAE